MKSNTLEKLSLSISSGLSGSLLNIREKEKINDNDIAILEYKNDKLEVVGWIDKNQMPQKSIYSLNINDIVMVRTGFNVGKVLKLDELKIKNYVLTANLIKIEVDTNEINSEYLYYYLTGLYMKGFYKIIMKKTLIPTISIKDVRKIEVNYERFLAKDSKIASNFSALKKHLEDYNTLLVNEQELKTYLFENIFNNKYVDEKELMKVKVNGINKNIPKNWKIVKMNEIIDFQRGTKIFKRDFTKDKSGKPVIRIKDLMNENKTDVYTDKDFNSKFYKNENDILISFTGYETSLNKKTSIGKVERKGEGYFSNDMYKMIIKDETKLDKDFMFIMFQTNLIRKGILKFAEGFTIKHANKSIEILDLLLPSLEEQKEIVKTINLQIKVVENIKHIIQLKEKIFKTSCINITN